MTDQITLKEALELVTFYQNDDGTWCVDDVHGNVLGNIEGEVYCNVWGCVHGNVDGVKGNVMGDVEGDVMGDVVGDVVGSVGISVYGHVKGIVKGTINGRQWQFVETPKDKLRRLIEENADKEQLLETLNQLKDN